MEVGSSISAGENIVQIDVIEGYKLRAQVDEHYISRLFAGLKASFEFGGKPHGLTVRKVYPEVVNGRFEVDLEFTGNAPEGRSEEHTSELQSLMRISYAVFCLNKTNKPHNTKTP